MDLNAYLLDSVFQATTPRGETPPAAQTRRQAIHAMFAAHAPNDAIQALIASNCVAFQFLLIAATKDAFDVEPDPVLQPKRRAAALSIGRTLAQFRRQLAHHQKPPARAKAAPAPRPPQPVPTGAVPTGAVPAQPVPSPKPTISVPPAPQWTQGPPATLTSHAALLAALPVHSAPHASG